MKIKDLLTELSYGELSNLSIGNSGDGTVETKNVPKLIVHINDALLHIYSHFVLNTKTLILEQIAGVTNYHLIKKFAESYDEVPEPYIKDTPGEPFLDDVIKVLSVFNEHVREVALNDKGNALSLFTPAPQLLQVPSPRRGMPLYVVYQARHKVLNLTDIEQEIIVPFVLEPALRAFVAHKVFSNMSGQEHLMKSQELGAAYASLIQEADDKDLTNNTTSTTHDKLRERGFI